MKGDNGSTNWFDHTFAFLDTNILSEMSRRTKRSDNFRPVFDFLQNNSVSIVLVDTTRFEFTGYTRSKKTFEERKQWLDHFTIISMTRDDLEQAAELSSIYKQKNPSISPNQISLTDCLYASQLVKYKERVFLVTTNVNDYPCFLFDIKHHMPIEEENGQITFVSFITFNEYKWKKIKKDFESSG